MRRLFACFMVVLSLGVYSAAAENTASDLIANASLTSTSAPNITIRKDVREVRVTFHASDRHNRPVMDLRPDSLTILDNGVPVSGVSAMHTTSDLPLSVALMVDASDSVARDFAAEQRASSTLIHGLMRSSDDRLMVVAFRHRVEMTHEMSADAQELAATMAQIKVGGLTALYDALVATSDRLAQSDSSASRRAIILISDGDDTDSHYILNDALAAAVRNDVAIYPVTVRTKHSTADGEKVLKQLADASGGRAYVVRGAGELSRAMQEIQCELRNQYFVTYRPPVSASGFHTVTVSSAEKDISIRARSGYFASNR